MPNLKDLALVYWGKLINVVETKVKAATTAATIVSLLLTYLGVSVFKGDVPSWVVVAVTGVVTGALTFLAAWLAKHTPRVLIDSSANLTPLAGSTLNPDGSYTVPATGVPVKGVALKADGVTDPGEPEPPAPPSATVPN
jgi:hypothetical protein